MYKFKINIESNQYIFYNLIGKKLEMEDRTVLHYGIEEDEFIHIITGPV